tara:strand:+ start:790 stop:921 length:132 start_codon:yes stop_codon:yes gene_type:complete
MKKVRQYRGNQGRSPKQMRSSYIGAFISIVGLAVTLFIIAVTS